MNGVRSVPTLGLLFAAVLVVGPLILFREDEATAREGRR